MNQIDLQHAITEIRRAGFDEGHFLLIVAPCDFGDAQTILGTATVKQHAAELGAFTIRLKEGRSIQSGFLLVPDPLLSEPL